MRGAWLLGLVALAALSGRLHARPVAGSARPDTTFTMNLPPAMPGAVITATVDVPRQVRGRGPAHFLIQPAPHVRLFGAPVGSFAGAVPDRIPLTFTLPRDQEAGPLLIATVAVLWGDGTVFTTELRLQVQPLRRIRLSLASAATAAPHRPWLLQYAVTNLGNANDLVSMRLRLPPGWRPPKPLPVHLVPQGDSAAGAIVVVVPGDARDGNYSITLEALGEGDTAAASAIVGVGRDQASAWVPLPGILFVGAPRLDRPGSTPDVSLQAEGNLTPATRFGLALRRGSNEIRPPAFYRYNSGPEYYAGLQRADFSAAAGDIYAPANDAVGMFGFGTGAQLAWNGATRGSLFLARPREIGSAMLAGHLARGAFAIPLGPGAVGVRVSDYARPFRQGLPQSHAQGGTLTFESLAGQEHSLALEAGAARIGADSGESRSGGVFKATYSYRSGQTYLIARSSRVPAVIPGAAGVNEDYVGGGVPVARGLQAVGWASSVAVPYLGMEKSTRASAAAGLMARGLRGSFQLRGEYDRNRSPAAIFGGAWVQKALAGSASLPAGRFGLEAYGNLGRIDMDGRTRPFRALTVRATLRSTAGAAWTGVDYYQGRFGTLPLNLAAGGSVRARGILVEGSAGAYLPAGRDPYLGHAWTAATIPLVARSALVAGVEYQPWLGAGSRVRYSLGLRTSVAVPVFVPLPAQASGTVFEDVNGDGIRNVQESAIPGVMLQLGGARVLTDASGRYAFRQRSLGTADLGVDLSSLPVGWLMEGTPRRGRDVDIPLVRAGSLTIKLVASDRGDSSSVRPPVADIAIDLTDRNGRVRSAASDADGLIRFGAVAPGPYTLTVYPVTARGLPLPSRTVPVEVTYGKPTEVTVAIPTNALEIRFRSAPPPGSH